MEKFLFLSDVANKGQYGLEGEWMETTTDLFYLKASLYGEEQSREEYYKRAKATPHRK